MNSLFTIAKNEWQNIIRNKTALIIIGAFSIILILAAYIGADYIQKQNDTRKKYQSIVKSQWNSQPNRHPHRVAHYGYLVFRESSPLSFFDFGVESFVGNSVFLEAHRQNSVNLSEAEFSNGLLRFGELNMAMALQLLAPLIIFFLGFGTISGLKENGVLKLILIQGISTKKLLWGKIVGLFSFSVFCLLMVTIFCFGYVIIFKTNQLSGDMIMRTFFTLILYMLYFAICSWITVMVSAMTKKEGNTLIILILLWMGGCIVLPKMSQTIGSNLYPSISKVEFEKNIKTDLNKEGDPHNPNDPHFTAYRNSILKKYNVNSINELPVNYAGLQMAEGERITSNLFNKHFDRIIETYNKQNRISSILSFVDPYLLIRNMSMTIAGTDMLHYIDFQQQAEQYRYKQTQYLNDIHAHKVKSINDKAQRVNKDVFTKRKTFNYKPKTIFFAIKNKILLIFSFLSWIIVLILSVSIFSKKISPV